MRPGRLVKADYPWRFGVFLAMYYACNGIWQGYAALYFKSTGLPTHLRSVIMACTPLVSIFMQPVWGAVADRSRSRNAVLRGLIAFSLIMALAYQVSRAFAWLLVCCALFSACYTSIQPLGDSILLEGLAPRNHPFGPIRMMGTLTFALTNLLWGLLLDEAHMYLVVYATAAMLGLVLIATKVLPAVPGHQSGGGRRMNMTAILRIPHMKGLMLLMLMLQLTYGYFYCFFSEHFLSLPGASNALVGLCYFISACSEVPFLLNCDRLYEKLGAGKLLCISSVALTLRWTLLAVTGNAYVAMASQVLHGWGFIVMTVTMAKYMSDVIPDELKASGQMLIGVVGFGIARTFGILGGGFVASFMGGIRMGFAMMAIVAGVTMLLFVPKYARGKPLNGRGE
ncbi:MAG: MFS transporter [Clostridia bacterium]|nr:MFS transporter [Clostridia bacterium]